MVVPFQVIYILSFIPFLTFSCICHCAPFQLPSRLFLFCSFWLCSIVSLLKRPLVSPITAILINLKLNWFISYVSLTISAKKRALFLNGGSSGKLLRLDFKELPILNTHSIAGLQGDKHHLYCLIKVAKITRLQVTLVCPDKD